MESGNYTSMTELAAAEKVDPSYLARMLRLTLLAPAIVEAILDGRQTSHIALADLMRPFPTAWIEQCEHFAVNAAASTKSATFLGIPQVHGSFLGVRRDTGRLRGRGVRSYFFQGKILSFVLIILRSVRCLGPSEQ